MIHITPQIPPSRTLARVVEHSQLPGTLSSSDCWCFEVSGFAGEVKHLVVEGPSAGVLIGRAREGPHQGAYRALWNRPFVNEDDAAVASAPGEPLAREGLEIHDGVCDEGPALGGRQFQDFGVEQAQMLPLVD